MIKTYILPDKLRSELRKIWGQAIFGKKTEVNKKFKKILVEKKMKKIITVGDYCSLNLPSNIKIFDGKIKRKEIKIPSAWKRNNLKTTNPSGTIQGQTWSKIRKAIKEERNLFVDGEEDLLVIPSVLLSEKNTAVVYGFPKKGICLIGVNSKIKKILKELLKKFNSTNSS